MRQFIDVHAHLQFTDFEADRELTIKRSFEAGVDIINVGTGAVSSQEAVILANSYDLSAVVGLHPVYINEIVPNDPDLVGEPESLAERFAVIEKLSSDPQVVAIGECGLDYFHVTSQREQQLQKEWFINQIELAQRVNKPLMLHIRNGKNKSDQKGAAYQDVLTILERYQGAKGDVHFFAGTIDEAKTFLDLGFYLSFTGVITFAKDYEELIKFVPLNRILAETDCPYVAPALFRGKRNEPAYVVEVVKKIAELKNQPLEVVATQIRQNAQNLFGV